jgi:hypothetical protein
MSEFVSFGQLNIKTTETPAEVIYFFRGDVDEHFRQQDVPRIQRDLITLELKEMNHFNSSGVREWVSFLGDLQRGGATVFKNCSITMIDQINMVPESLGAGRIHSFFAPYFCKCSGEKNQLIDIAEHRSKINNRLAPEIACDTCGEPMEFDALEESYFLFAEKECLLTG